MSAFLDGIGTLIGTIAKHLTPGQRARRLQDERDKLDDERKKLISQPASLRNGKRLLAIDLRIIELDKLLANQAGRD